MFRSKNEPVCDYSNPRNEEPWFCEAPASRKCSKIKTITYDQNVNFSINFEDVCSQYGCHTIVPQNTIVTVISVDYDATIARNALPSCTNMFLLKKQSKPRVTGFFERNHWNSLLCSHSLESLETLSARLKNKVVYFFGDSTIRQFFALISSTLSMNVGGPDSTKIYQQPKVARTTPNHDQNITMYYRAHGPPLRNPGPPYTRPYISDSILGIPAGGQNVIVILNVGAHLYQHHPSFYIHRIRGIRAAIEKHHRIFPETRFIVRGLNVVEHADEWSIYRLNLLLQESFYNIKNVIFLDLWDLTTVKPMCDYHPYKGILLQEALHMFSHIV